MNIKRLNLTLTMGKDIINVIQLNGENYIRWKYDVEITLKGLQLWPIVIGTRQAVLKKDAEGNDVPDAVFEKDISCFKNHI